MTRNGGAGVASDSPSYLTSLLLKQLPHLAYSALAPHHLYTLAHPGRPKHHGTSQLPPLLALAKGGAPPSSSSSRITSVSSYAGSFVRERLDDILVVRGRGLTRTPHPDEALILDSVDEGPGIMPQHLHQHQHQHHFHTQVSSVYSTPASSGRSSPTADTHSTLTPSQGGWTTGNDTDRSSLDSSYSWDEFDRQAAKTVTLHFEEIERFLFGEVSSEKASGIRNECRDWSNHFPHLRILGTQKLEPTDTGYREYPRDSPRHSTGLLLDVTDNDITISSDSQGLILTGRGIKPVKAPVDGTSLHPDPHNEYAHLLEEVFAQDGLYEEVIALDYKDIHEDSENKKQITPRRRRIGYPPITPNACVKDSVASSVFDCMWNEIIAWMRPLLKECTLFLSDSKPDQGRPSVFQMTALPLEPGPNTRESSYLGMIPKTLPPYGLTRAHTITTTTSTPDNNRCISELLQINPITLNPKHRSQEVAEVGTTMGRQRPASKTQNRSRQRLAPITSNNRSQTPMVDESIPSNALHVTSITFPKSSPYPAYQRNTALPPLYTDIQQDKTTAKRKTISVRASSAIDNKDVRNWHHFNKERQPVDPRPSTTHAMRSDTPLGSSGRRSSTPLSYSKGFHGSKSLGITGNSLQHPTDLSHAYPNIMEDEGMEESPLHNQFPKDSLWGLSEDSIEEAF